jgi:hypothetical protein
MLFFSPTRQTLNSSRLLWATLILMFEFPAMCHLTLNYLQTRDSVVTLRRKYIVRILLIHLPLSYLFLYSFCSSFFLLFLLWDETGTVQLRNKRLPSSPSYLLTHLSLIFLLLLLLALTLFFPLLLYPFSDKFVTVQQSKEQISRPYSSYLFTRTFTSGSGILFPSWDRCLQQLSKPRSKFLPSSHIPYLPRFLSFLILLSSVMFILRPILLYLLLSDTFCHSLYK